MPYFSIPYLPVPKACSSLNISRESLVKSIPSPIPNAGAVVIVQNFKRSVPSLRKGPIKHTACKAQALILKLSMLSFLLAKKKTVKFTGTPRNSTCHAKWNKWQLTVGQKKHQTRMKAGKKKVNRRCFSSHPHYRNYKQNLAHCWVSAWQAQHLFQSEWWVTQYKTVASAGFHMNNEVSLYKFFSVMFMGWREGSSVPSQ